MLRRLEGAFWLTRPHTIFAKVPFAAAGWAIGRGDHATSPIEATLLVVVVVAAQALMFVVDDINDAEKDRLTAPYLPIPQGLLSRRDACIEAALLVGLSLGGALALTTTPWVVIAVVLSAPLAIAVLMLYSRRKAAWYSAMVLGTTASAGYLILGWLLSGFRDGSTFIIALVITALHGIHINLRAQIYDIEGDPKAGTLTLAARLGPRRALQTAALIRIAEVTGVAVLAWVQGMPIGALWLVPTVALLVVAVAQLPTAYATTRDRRGQTDALFIWVYVSFFIEAAVFGVFRPLMSVILAVSMFLWFHTVRPAYYRRLLGSPSGGGAPG